MGPWVLGQMSRSPASPSLLQEPRGEWGPAGPSPSSLWAVGRGREGGPSLGVCPEAPGGRLPPSQTPDSWRPRRGKLALIDKAAHLALCFRGGCRRPTNYTPSETRVVGQLGGSRAMPPTHQALIWLRAACGAGTQAHPARTGTCGSLLHPRLAHMLGAWGPQKPQVPQPARVG